MPTTWDQSILSISLEELSEMTEEGRRERLADEINRAADLLRTVAQAFGEDLRSDQATLVVAASSASQVARKFM